MADFKKPVFSPDAAEEYFSMLLTSYRDTANDIFRRDNEGRHASEQHYSAEYQKYVGMQIAMREVLEYFGKFDLGDWISVKDRLPDIGVPVLVAYHNFNDGELQGDGIAAQLYGPACWYWWEGSKEDSDDEVVVEITHWKPLPELPEEATYGTE